VPPLQQGQFHQPHPTHDNVKAVKANLEKKHLDLWGNISTKEPSNLIN